MKAEFEVLDKINKNSDIKQRDISQETGLSLGSVNLIIKNLIKKGYLTAKRINSRNIKYLVTPSGIEMISRKSFNYYKKTVFIVKEYQDKIDYMVRDIVEEGYSAIRIEGNSSLEFLLENSSYKYGLKFLKEDIEGEKICIVYSEDYELNNAENKYYLKKIL